MSDPHVVVGGGIAGSAVAYHLARTGDDVVLYDRADDGQATAAGAGVISPPTSSRNADPAWYDFGADAADYYPELSAALRDLTDGPVGYDPTELMAVAVSEDETTPHQRLLDRTRRRQRERGYPAAGSLTELSPSAARDRVDGLARPTAAFAYENAARLDGRTFRDALQTAVEALGGTVRNETVERLSVVDDAVRAVHTPDSRQAAASVTVAGGAWSSEFERSLGVDLPVSPTRGQIAHLRTSAETASWPILTAHRGHYMVPWDDGRVAVGATREDDAGFDPTVTAGGAREVLAEALRVVPGLQDATLIEMRVGLRPTSADRRPILGPLPGLTNAHVATGFGATGLTLAPYAGAVVADAVTNDDTGAIPDAFRPGREYERDAVSSH